MLGILMITTSLLAAGIGGSSSPDPVFARSQAWEEAIGFITVEGPDSNAPELVLEAVFENGYCKRGFVALGAQPGGGRMRLGQAISARGVSFEYGLAEKGRCSADVAYFRPAIPPHSSGDVVDTFLGSLNIWRRSKHDVPRFVVRSSYANAIDCVRSTSALQVTALWAFQPNDGRDELYRAVFEGCRDPKTGDELAATIDFERPTRTMTVDLAYDAIVRP